MRFSSLAKPLSAVALTSTLLLTSALGPQVAHAQSVPDVADAYVPTAPSPLVMGHRQHLVWEIWVTNRSAEPLRVTRLEVDDEAARPVVRLEGEALASQFRVLGDEVAEGVTTLELEETGVVYLWYTLDEGAALPTRFENRLAIVVGDGAEQVRHLPVDVLPDPPRVLQPPVLGEGWVVVNAPSNESRHRRSVQVFDDGRFTAQRYAIDLARASGGSSFEGDPRDNASYFAYGAEVLAVADGTIVSVRDGIPENVPTSGETAVAIDYDTLTGNTVVLDIGGDRYAVYAHLQPGSLRAQPGDAVVAGQVLGLVGNSGSSSEPHLHLHVCDRPDALRCHGRPYAFSQFVRVPLARSASGEVTADEPELVHDELPPDWSYLIFAPPGALGPPGEP